MTNSEGKDINPAMHSNNVQDLHYEQQKSEN
jgi:hypothetical protein